MKKKKQPIPLPSVWHIDSFMNHLASFRRDFHTFLNVIPHYRAGIRVKNHTACITYAGTVLKVTPHYSSRENILAHVTEKFTYEPVVGEWLYSGIPYRDQYGDFLIDKVGGRIDLQIADAMVIATDVAILELEDLEGVAK